MTMLKVHLHRFIALILLLAFTSQTLATAAMNCEQGKTVSISRNIATTQMNMGEMDMSTMDYSDPSMMQMHDHTNTTNSPQNSHQKFDCCKTMGHCLFGGCSLAAASKGIIFMPSKFDSIAEDFYLGITPPPLASSHYRPPIFC
jgi:hypothetical protein